MAFLIDTFEVILNGDRIMTTKLGAPFTCMRADEGSCPDGRHELCESYCQGFILGCQWNKSHVMCFDTGIREGSHMGLAGLLNEVRKPNSRFHWVPNHENRENRIGDSKPCFCKDHKQQTVDQLTKNVLKVEAVVHWMKEKLTKYVEEEGAETPKSGVACGKGQPLRASPPPRKRKQQANGKVPAPAEKKKKKDEENVDPNVAAESVKKPLPPKKRKPEFDTPSLLAEEDDNAVDMDTLVANSSNEEEADEPLSSQVLDSNDLLSRQVSVSHHDL